MKECQELRTAAVIHKFGHRSMKKLEPVSFSTIQVLNSDTTKSRSQDTDIPFQVENEQFFTLESTPASPSSIGVSSNRNPFPPHASPSYASDLYNSSDYNCCSSSSGFYGISDENKQMHDLWLYRNELLEPEFTYFDSNNSFRPEMVPFTSTRYHRVLEMAPLMDLKQVLYACAETVSEADSSSPEERRLAVSAVESLMDILAKKVSVSGDPLQRLGAYLLEGLRARLLSSGNIIYKKLKCDEPTSSELMSYMHVLYEICPYYKFAYASSNVVIEEAMENEDRIHIIDFQIAQGSQWVSFIENLSHRPGGPPWIRITGVDDSQSAHARGGGLELIGKRLATVAETCGVPFEFNAAAMTGSEVQSQNLQIRHGESLAVNFPYVLHHMPDESVSTENHRDRLLRLVKSLSPRIVTLAEQESKTNTAPFFHRFCETLDFYMAIFESIDTARPRDDKQRMRTEEQCVARDIVNIIACEGIDRMERHELFGKWRMRLTMAGFSPVPLSSSVIISTKNVLKEYSSNYGLAVANDALYLGWKNRALYTSSAWR